MSEHALKLANSGNGSAAQSAASGVYPALAGGKAEPEVGNKLPMVAAEEAPDLEVLVKELNTVSRNISRDLHFEVDLKKGRAVLQVLDRETGELIRQIPQEKAQVAVQANGTLSVRLIDAVI